MSSASAAPSTPEGPPPGFTDAFTSIDRYMDDPLVETNPEAVARLIACVLRRAHRMAEALMSPNEARAILYVAHSFADELSTANPQFDRLRFIRDATEQRSARHVPVERGAS